MKKIVLMGLFIGIGLSVQAQHNIKKPVSQTPARLSTPESSSRTCAPQRLPGYPPQPLPMRSPQTPPVTKPTKGKPL